MANISNGPSDVSDAWAQDPALVRDEELWFPDGGIILVAEWRAFRVYHGLLMRESTVFSDLLSLPEPESATRMDGCPIVRLSDAAEDLRHLLRFLLNRRYFMPAGEPIEFAAVAALVRLGHKYQLDIVEAEGLRLLKTVFTTSHHQQPDIIYRSDNPDGQPQNIESVVKYETQDAITAVNLARLTGDCSILPTAFYMCCQLDGETLVLGNTGGNGVPDCLSPSDLAMCINGKRALMHAHARAALSVLELPGPDEANGWSSPDWFIGCDDKDLCRFVHQ